MTAAKKTAKKAVSADNQFEVTPVDFVIDVILEQDRGAPKPYPVPRNIPKEMHLGDTVRYRSNDGDVKVRFDEPDKSRHKLDFYSPFSSKEKEIQTISSKDRAVKVVNRGTYFGKCSIRVTKRKAAVKNGRARNLGKPPLKAGVYVWTKGTPEAGGNHIVKP
jgi:hypothetical protein